MKAFLRSSWGMATMVFLALALVSVASVTLPHTVQTTRTEEVAGAAGPGDESVIVSGEPGAAQGSGTVDAAGHAVSSGAKSAGAKVGGSAAHAGGSGPAAAADLKCAAGQNGGATDVGVTATKINLASTVVLSGIGASFLSESPKAMQAVINKVNRSGGICGRQLSLTARDDKWDPSLGQQFLGSFMQSKQYFAFPVVPSSEGLTAAIRAGDIARGGMPVIGSDGMLIEQYKEPLVWPVATATVSTMRIMAKYGYDHGARKFGIVYDNQYKFGLEGADAFKSYVESLPGAQLKSYVGIRPGESSYGSEVQKFNSDCGSDCDMVTMLLEPSTAETWIAGRPVRGKMLTTGAQTLFNRRFAQNCRAACQDMLVWTGYNPPIDALASLPGVADYVNDVKAIDPGIDTTNAFAEGAYLGMSVFVEALRRVGPNLTRDRLRQVLDSMDLTTDLASPLSWRPDHRFANSRAQAFSLQYAGDDFSGFRNEQTGWIADPHPSSGV